MLKATPCTLFGLILLFFHSYSIIEYITAERFLRTTTEKPIRIWHQKCWPVQQRWSYEGNVSQGPEAQPRHMWDRRHLDQMRPRDVIIWSDQSMLHQLLWNLAHLQSSSLCWRSSAFCAQCTGACAWVYVTHFNLDLLSSALPLAFLTGQRWLDYELILANFNWKSELLGKIQILDREIFTNTRLKTSFEQFSRLFTHAYFLIHALKFHKHWTIFSNIVYKYIF